MWNFLKGLHPLNCFFSIHCMFWRWAIPGLFFFILVFSTVQLTDKISPMSGIELVLEATALPTEPMFHYLYKSGHCSQFGDEASVLVWTHDHLIFSISEGSTSWASRRRSRASTSRPSTTAPASRMTRSRSSRSASTCSTSKIRQEVFL